MSTAVYQSDAPCGGKLLVGHRWRRASPASSSASRCLFGRADPAERRRDLAAIWQRLEEQCNRRWNFDFKAGRPLAATTAAGHWQWTKETTTPTDRCDADDDIRDVVRVPIAILGRAHPNETNVADVRQNSTSFEENCSRIEAIRRSRPTEIADTTGRQDDDRMSSTVASVGAVESNEDRLSLPPVADESSSRPRVAADEIGVDPTSTCCRGQSELEVRITAPVAPSPTSPASCQRDRKRSSSGDKICGMYPQ